MIKLRRKDLLTIAALSIPNALLQFIILYSVSIVLGKDDFNYINHSLLFFSALTYYFFLHRTIQKKIIKVSSDFIYKNELEIITKISKSEVANITQIDPSKIYGVLEDLRSLIFIPYTITNSINSAIVIIVGFSILLYISSIATILLIVLLFLLLFIYKNINNTIIVKSNISRELTDNYFKFIRDLTEGFKELKLNTKKRLNVTDFSLIANRIEATKSEEEISNLVLLTNMMGGHALLWLIGLTVFGLPSFHIITSKDAAAFVTVLLFISGAINTAISLQAFFVKIRIANSRLSQFLSMLENIPEERPETSTILGRFEKIEFKDVTFTYPNAKSPSLKSCDLVINRGETIFIIGSNGSGKSTFINLLTNLISPQEGKILINSQPVGTVNETYRNMFSPVFTENYLFSNNYDPALFDNHTLFLKYVELLKMQEKIQHPGDLFANAFSTGQSKRVSLIISLLENRPILVLDEWAADQDPYFRKYFYTDILPKLKESGKTIIAVTHDDLYFDIADKVVKFHKGFTSIPNE